MIQKKRPLSCDFLAFSFLRQIVSSSLTSQKASLRFRLTPFHSIQLINHKHSGLLRGVLWGTFAVYKSSTQDIFCTCDKVQINAGFSLSCPGVLQYFQARRHKTSLRGREFTKILSSRTNIHDNLTFTNSFPFWFLKLIELILAFRDNLATQVTSSFALF